MGNVIMKAQQITYGASNVEKALDDLKAPELIELNKRMAAIDEWKANVHEVTYTGSELTINNALALPARSLITEINAIQDLHGYDHPWAGGACKNKVETPSATAFAACGITLTTASNGETTLNGTSTAGSIDGDTFELPAGTYTISVGTTLPSGVWVSLDGVGGAMINPTAKSISFTTTEAINTFTHIYVNAGVAFNNFKLNWMLEEGSTATSFAPYSNICPISGRTEARVDDVGKNLLPYDAWKTVGIIGGSAIWENNGVTLTATANDCYTRFLEHDFPQGARIPITNGQKITISWQETTNKHGLVAIFPNASMTGLVTADNATAKKVTYTGKSGDTFITFRFGVTNSGDTIAYKNIMIEYGETSHDYEPYAHSSATIQLGTTVYGADINWDTGVMTVTDGMVDLGDLTWTAVNGSRFLSVNEMPNVKIDTSVSAPRNAICSQYVWKKGGDLFNLDDAGFSYYIEGGENRLFVKDLRYSDAASFKAAMDGVTLVYELATPTTIQLTPTMLEMLKGYNRVTLADGYGEIELKALVLGGDN